MKSFFRGQHAYKVREADNLLVEPMFAQHFIQNRWLTREDKKTRHGWFDKG